MPRQPSSSTSHAPASRSLLPATDEITPLLRKASRSLSNTFYGERPARQSSDGASEGDVESDDEIDGQGGREVEVYTPGKSTFSQTVRPHLQAKPAK
jgi:hypothetical protein